MSLYFCRNFITHINKKLKIMSKVTVVGAGNVGATCANVLAFNEVADEVPYNSWIYHRKRNIPMKY